MADIQSTGGGGRRTSLELNLVPFIDLMSVLITFLLITAVWSQVSMIQIGSSIYGKKSETQLMTPTPDSDIVLKVDVRTDGYDLFVGKEKSKIPFKDGDYDDAALSGMLAQVKQKYPDKVDASIAMEDVLPYERLIHVMDACLKSGFSGLSVLTGGPR